MSITIRIRNSSSSGKEEGEILGLYDLNLQTENLLLVISALACHGLKSRPVHDFSGAIKP
jgi:hypothetical protein